MRHKKKRAMKHISFLLCLCSASFFVFGFLHQPSIASIRLSDHFHAGVLNEGFDSRLLVFNDEIYDPSVLETHFSGDIKKTLYISTLPGIYYRYIQTDLDTHWVCQFSPFYLIVIFGLLVIYFYLQETFYRNVPGKTDPDDGNASESQT